MRNPDIFMEKRKAVLKALHELNEVIEATQYTEDIPYIDIKHNEFKTALNLFTFEGMWELPRKNG